jgi:hypothetical protein
MADPPPDFATLLTGCLQTLKEQFTTDLTRARAAERRELTAQLNNALRRLQQSESRDIWVRTLLDAAAPFCAQAACFRVEGNRAIFEGISEAEADPPALDFDLTSAPALASAAESKDVVVTAATAGQLSEDVQTLLQFRGQKLYVFPLVNRTGTTALLCADPGDTPVDVSALELLASVGAFTVPVPEPPKPAGLIRIAAPPSRPSAARPTWEDLPGADQEIHLRAQRFARTRIADLILHKTEKVREGRASRDLYGTLRFDIDAGRETFRSQFVRGCPSMVDYYHLELVRTLAQDNADLLGPDYPGPLP